MGSSGGNQPLEFVVSLKHCVSSKSSLLSLRKLSGGGCCGPSHSRGGNSGEEDTVGLPCVQAMLLQGWDTSDLCLSAHLLMSKGRVPSLGSLLQWLGGASPLPKQLCLLLSTVHHRRSFSTAQNLMDLDCTDVVLPLLRWFPL